MRYPFNFYLAAALLLLLTSCSSESKLNHFILPAGYKGPIALVVDPSFDSKGYWDGSRFIHVVSNFAVTCVSTDQMLRTWFRLTAEYSDGTLIYSTYQGLPEPPSENSLRIAAFGSWGGSSESTYVHWFGVGTEAEVKDLEGAFFSGNIQELMPPTIEVPAQSIGTFEQFRPYCGD